MTARPARRVLRPHPTTAPPWWRSAAWWALGISLALVVALWLHNGGLTRLGTAAGTLITFGRLTGLLSADLLLVQVLLMARIPLLERSFGQDKLTRGHIVCGVASVTLMLVHVALTMVGYSLTDGVSVTSSVLDAIVHFPGLLLAAVGTVLLTAVLITSSPPVRGWLRYESWHLLHLYAYLGIGFSVPHEVWTGADFVYSAPARAYWWTAYAAAAGSVLIWRLAVPLWRSSFHGLRVERVVAESPDVVSVHIGGRQLHRLGASAGQYFVWRFLDGSGWTRGHPYSLSAAPQPDLLRFTAKITGDGSAQLTRLRPGTRVLIEGPYGRLHRGVRTRTKVTLLASGIGITPMRAMMAELDHGPGELTLIYRASTPVDLVLRQEIDEIAARTGARVHYVIGRRATGRRSTWLPEGSPYRGDVKALLDLVPDLADHDVYVCGASAWADAAGAAARGAGVPDHRIHLERFTS